VKSIFPLPLGEGQGEGSLHRMLAMPDQYPSAPRRSIQRARRLRTDAPVPERILWGILRESRLGGLKFRRQHPIGPFFADFYCHDANLVVELDGMSHDGRGEADRRRETFLRRQGLKVVRVGNDDVLRDIEAVAIAILKGAGLSPDCANGPHPGPLPKGEGELRRQL
jgi:very-short-patch-repair endonuclease